MGHIKSPKGHLKGIEKVTEMGKQPPKLPKKEKKKKGCLRSGIEVIIIVGLILFILFNFIDTFFVML